MDDCIFCKIVKGEIPSSKILENEDFLVFLDINPVSKGHTLIIPKEHIKWIEESSDKIISDIFLLTKKIIKKIKSNLGCDFVQVSIMGEEVPHFHIHLIPEYFNIKTATWVKTKYDSQEEIESIIKKINS